MAMKLGSEMVLEALRKEGVEAIFGYPGGAVLPIYDALYDSGLRHILARHEQGAVHMADGFARASGRVGVALVTSGPGATNTVTGLATAYMDSIPVVVLTGQVPTSLIGNDAFQEADTVGITRPVTKHNYLVKSIKDLPRILKEAFYIAASGRPGPVVVDLPKDVVSSEGEFDYPEAIALRSYRPTVHGHIGQVKKALEMLFDAKAPVIFVGGGVILSNASDRLTQFARRLGVPVTMSLMGLGGFPGTDPLSLGMLGMHGTYQANMAIQNADLIFAVGPRFDDRVTGKVETFAPKAKIIHIDVDPTSISKSIRVDIPIVGDARVVMGQFLEELDRVEPPKEYFEDLKHWRGRVENWKAMHALDYDKNGSRIRSQYVIETLYGLTGGNAVVATDVGQHQMWVAQFFKFDKPRTFLTSGGLGTMGFGFPAALGAKIARPNETVIAISGDGSIQMNIQELMTAVQYGIGVKVVILNNGFLGMVRQWQELFHRSRYSSSCMAMVPDFVKLAEAYGALGLSSADPKDVVPLLEKALAHNGPVFVEFRVSEEDNVYPMVPPGGSIGDMLLV
mgnify:CR=1 FL=1